MMVDPHDESKIIASHVEVLAKTIWSYVWPVFFYECGDILREFNFSAIDHAALQMMVNDD